VLTIAYIGMQLRPQTTDLSALNLYEILELENTMPDAGQLKKAYRDASKKYHPDKNLETDTTDVFLQVKLASDVIGTPYKKAAYDLTGQTKFENEDRYEDRLKEEDHLSESERADKFWQYIKAQRQMQVVFDVVPFYVSWTASSFLMIERKVGRNAAALFCIGMGYLEYQARVQYGNEGFSPIFTGFSTLFPKQWTMGQSLQMCR
jgi:curved DNA-binding protein CbpA